MKYLQSLFCFAFALGMGVHAEAAWLVPGTPYKPTASTTINPATATEWSIFNAESEASEDVNVGFSVDANGVLNFTTTDIFADDLKAYLMLGISGAETDTTQNPVLMQPSAGKIRTDNLTATVTFVPSDVQPSVEDLQEMYPTYADREAVPSSPVSAKLGLYVASDNYFYVSRVRSGTKSETDGTSDSLIFEFCPTKVAYTENGPVGNGAVDVRIEFQTYSTDPQSYIRAFRIWVKKAGADASTEICLTEGLGYQWKITGTDYYFDFASLEGDEGDWFYCVDNAYAIVSTNLYYNPDGIDYLNAIGFAATGGNFAGASLAVPSETQSLSVLQTYNLERFAPYMSSSEGFSVYVDWATRYNVDISQYLEQADSTYSLLSESDPTLSEQAFNAFMLNMDPAEASVTEQRLTVTGLVLEEDKVVMTVRGPNGANLSNIPASTICVRRSDDLTALSTVTPVKVPTDKLLSKGESMILELPIADGEKELPFIQVTLEPTYE